MRTIGTKVMGIRTPIIKQGDDLVAIVVDSLMASAQEEGFALRDRDVVGVTEAVVARAQGNYATTAQIAADVHARFPQGTVGVIFPILSRNRFSLLLRGISMGAERVIVQLDYPADEVGNEIIDFDRFSDSGLNPYSDALTEADFRRHFGEEVKHRFTGIDYINLYKSLGDNIEVILCSDPLEILKHTDQVIAANIHRREHTKRSLRRAGARNVCGLDDFLMRSVDGSGYNEMYGLLGSNKASEDSVKLFPRNCEAFVADLQKALQAATGRRMEVLIYGDGGFKDPVGGIWELADPVISPAFTDGLRGTPNEIKLKYVADNEFSDLSGKELQDALKDAIRNKERSGRSLVGKMEAEGTTPRQLTDLLGSLCDLTSGSGDKGTPVVLIQGYFDNYATEGEKGAETSRLRVVGGKA